MDQLIETILETDRKAGEKTAAAMRRQAETGAAIAQRKQELHDEYIARAEKRLKVLEEKEAELAGEALAEFTAASNRQTERLEELYHAHRQEWIAAVTERALGEDTPC